MSRGQRMTIMNGPGSRDTLRRARALAEARASVDVTARGDWFRIVTNAATRETDVYLYDEIGYWGTSAGDFANQLAAIDAKTINVRVNSPGGEVFDGIAIYNALQRHPATINVYVDALAASIASVIIMAGDKIVMGTGAQLMIHDASAFVQGNAADLREGALTLDKISDSIATFYARKAGGSVTSWRDAMRAETWYSAEEAVAAGLADEVTAVVLEEELTALLADRVWNLGELFKHSGRLNAPAPVIVAKAAPAVMPPAPDPFDLEALAATLPHPEPEIEFDLSGLDIMASVSGGLDLHDIAEGKIDLGGVDLFAAIKHGTGNSQYTPPAEPVAIVPSPSDEYPIPPLDLRAIQQAVRG